VANATGLFPLAASPPQIHAQPFRMARLVKLILKS